MGEVLQFRPRSGKVDDMPSFTETTDPRTGWTERITDEGWTIRSRKMDGRDLYAVTVIDPARKRVVRAEKVDPSRLREWEFFPENAWPTMGGDYR